MLRTVGGQATLWETVLPVGVAVMSPELARVDALLDDERFFEPFRVHFDPVWGRPSIPIETYLRLMFLKSRYRLGYETLCAEVADSISWQRFCRIGVGGGVPHPTTLMKITTRCGSSTVEQLNEVLIAKAVEAKLVKTNRVRADTTVVEANVKYPTDSGLLTRAIGKAARLVERIQATGAAARTTVADNTAQARSSAHSIGVWLRRRSGQARDEVLVITGRIADLAAETMTDAVRVVRNARRHLIRHRNIPKAGRLAAMINDLDTLVQRANQVIGQTRQRIAGETPPGATRLVSLHDPDARPIRKGRLGRPVEFGYKAQVVDNEDGIVLDHTVEIGNPPDAPQLVPAIGRVIGRCGRPPDAVTADRGYGQATIDKRLGELGIGTVAIPRPGTPSKKRRAEQNEVDFRELVRWRTGAEGRISALKRQHGWNRTRLDTIEGARTWCGHGVFAHNLTKIARLQT
ncbi:MAG: ISNCY family transposase [Candidatus Nanopelagicales bacterium]|nr:ISNCY family transposase [Candidatus Nanopelagicales bacterium]